MLKGGGVKRSVFNSRMKVIFNFKNALNKGIVKMARKEGGVSGINR
jgi:hypothetical protein